MKLFWNTHNQNKSFWGEYHLLNSKEWIFDILGEIKFKEIEDLNLAQNTDSLIVVDSEISGKKDFYEILLNKYKRIYLIHLGDEGGRINKKIYSNFQHVFRTFYLNSFSKLGNVTCVPLGYKSGVSKNSIEIINRKYKWNFLGSIHGASRYDLIFQNKKIAPNYINITKKFGGENSIKAKEYYEIMRNTIFALVSHGYFHPETYRMYEALESGCIPIIENPYKIFNKFLPENPMIEIQLWNESTKIIEELISDKNKLKNISATINNWWSNYKSNLRKEIKEKLYV